MPKYLISWTPKHGKRSRGRQRTSWLKCVQEDATIFTGQPNTVLDEIKELASHRKHWRELIRNKREFLGAGHSND